MDRGFTLLELLLVIACLSIIVTFGAPLYQQLQVRTDLDAATMTYVKAIRRAQFLSQGSDTDSGWGVYVQSGTVTLYRGSAYIARIPTSDVVSVMPGSISVGGINEINVSKFYGMPLVTGSTTLTSINGEVRTVSINSKGMVSY